MLNSMFFSVLFPGHSSHRFSRGTSDSRSSLIKVFILKELPQQGFRKNMFGDSKVEFGCFSNAPGVVFLTFAALETGLKMECFFKVTLGILNGSRR